MPVLRPLPGLLAVAAVVAAAYGVNRIVPSLSPLIGAMLVGVAVAPLARRVPGSAVGMRLAARTLLRAGVALLGLRISLGDLASLGPAGLAIAAGTIAGTIGVTLLLAPRLRVERDLALLIATGSAICGASAIAAMEPLTRAREEEVGYAVATVTLFGTAAMLLIPVLGPALGLDAHATALWAGASIHEVAQVAGAGAAISAAGLKLATLLKLARVSLLAPAVATVSAARGRSGARTGAPLPGFVVAFLGFVLLRTLVPLPDAALHAASTAATLLLAAGLAGLGLQVRLGALRAAGGRPLALGLAAWAAAAATALALVVALG